jgi:hypothetical protein
VVRIEADGERLIGYADGVRSVNLDASDVMETGRAR